MYFPKWKVIFHHSIKFTTLEVILKQQYLEFQSDHTQLARIIYITIPYIHQRFPVFLRYFLKKAKT